MALSKPKLPLGVARIQGKRKCVLFEPFETEEEEEVCCICLSPHPWGQHCDLQCLHTMCYVCLRKMIVEQVRSHGVRAPWKCPMCRKDLHSCARLLPPESAIEGVYRTIHFVEDYFNNWIVIIAEDPTGASLAVLEFKGLTASKLVWIHPYHGWYIKDGAPNKNPFFEKIPYV